MSASSARPFLVDPFHVTDRERNDAALEAFFLFCTAVAGKKATVITDKAARLLEGIPHAGTPLERLAFAEAGGGMAAHLRRVALGKHGLFGRCWRAALARPKGVLADGRGGGAGAPAGDRAENREVFPRPLPGGCPSRRGGHAHAQVPARHEHAWHPPGNAVPPRLYPALEKSVLAHADRFGLDPADFDLRVWRWYAGGGSGLPPAGLFS